MSEADESFHDFENLDGDCAQSADGKKYENFGSDEVYGHIYKKSVGELEAVKHGCCRLTLRKDPSGDQETPSEYPLYFLSPW